ncbi:MULTISPECIES: hypothetical protein [Agrobacterium]|uniref:IacB n=1 Tax=Agrobacterium larrymoorei TaxID=160699 RepID=A0AAJ2BDF6_9HYPH|nr:hypothetical protein [Agrobacterium larrymoorei]MDQ1183722.1 hypothetical protein [Agrobacterium larrymoorei]MDQ1195436.1 hypothetical protein [Rhizobium sp. SORGH_AS_0787]MDR6100941.1 hypothetical protein [Agrobacterium larrymoorei]
MTEKPIRTLFCIAVLQNFFDLPSADIGVVWKATGKMLSGIANLPGVTILGTLDDDETMVGTSPNGWPWTCYILADCPDRETVRAACNLFRTIEVGEHRLWKYLRVEARMGRVLEIPAL